MNQSIPFHSYRADDRRPAPVPPRLMCRFLCQRLARAHRLWSHPFLKRCQTERLTVTELRVLVTQMYKVSRTFPRFLSTIARACPDSLHRMQLATCLWNILGRGDPNRAHPALLRTFAHYLGLDERALTNAPMLPQTGALIDSYLDMADRRGFVGALGSACYASEALVGPLYTQLRAAVVRSTSLPDEAFSYFAQHTADSASSTEKLSRMLEFHIDTRADVRVAAEAMLESLDARSNFFDGVVRASLA